MKKQVREINDQRLEMLKKLEKVRHVGDVKTELHSFRAASVGETDTCEREIEGAALEELCKKANSLGRFISHPQREEYPGAVTGGLRLKCEVYEPVPIKVLATAAQNGSAKALKPVVEELRERGHQVSVYATGSESEAIGFGDVGYWRIVPPQDTTINDYKRFLGGLDAVLVGLSGYNTPDGHFLRAANATGVRTIGVLDQDGNYKTRLEENPEEWPNVLAVMDSSCLDTMQEQLGEELGRKLGKRTRVVGWMAFDHLAELRERFGEEKRNELLARLGIKNLSSPIHFHATQNIHPDTEYIQRVVAKMEPGKRAKYLEERARIFDYEMQVTRAVFEVAGGLGLNHRLLVKPHPGEKFRINFTEDLSRKHGVHYLPADVCDTKELMLASYSVTAGRSTCLTEACLLDRNVGGILPDLSEEEIKVFPPVALGAIPYTQTWYDEENGIPEILRLVTSHDEEVNRQLAEGRKLFQVDGGASERLSDAIEREHYGVITRDY